MKKTKEVFTVLEMAKALRVHVNTIYHAIKDGRIQAFRVGYGKRATLRIFRSEIMRMAEFDASAIIDKIVEDRLRKRQAPLQRPVNTTLGEHGKNFGQPHTN